MREIVLDTETTGLSPSDGHRLVEIACVELTNRLPSGREYQTYINPERDMPSSAFAVHGLSAEFLAGHPLFADVVEDFLAFIGDSPLVIHNAEFDLRFLNAELDACGRAVIDSGRAVDTLLMARNAFPGAQASLDALCKRFGIDNRHRDKHGALIDCHLLAEVYLELTGGRQSGLSLTDDPSAALSPGPGRKVPPADPAAINPAADIRPPRPHAAGSDEQAAHAAMLQRLSEPLWLK